MAIGALGGGLPRMFGTPILKVTREYMWSLPALQCSPTSLSTLFAWFLDSTIFTMLELDDGIFVGSTLGEKVSIDVKSEHKILARPWPNVWITFVAQYVHMMDLSMFWR